MNTLTVVKNQRGLVFKNGQLVQVLQAGTYRFFSGKNVQLVPTKEAISADSALFAELEGSEFMELLHRFEVAPDQILLRYLGKNILETYGQGTYFFWKSEMPYSYEITDIGSSQPITQFERSLLETSALADRIRKVGIPEGHQLVVFVNGAFQQILPADTYYFWKNAHSYTFNTADQRIMHLDVQGQELLTKDKTSIRINFAGQYRLVHIQRAFVENASYYTQMYAIIQLTIREIIGAQTLDQLLETKAALSDLMVTQANALLENLGIQLLSGGIKDIILPGDVKEILNKVLVAEKQAQANMITRREETATTRNLLNTARLMEENDMLYKLKEMEFVERIAEKINGIQIQSGSHISDQLKTLFTK